MNMEIINYFETSRYNSKKTVGKEVANEFKTFAIYAYNFINSHRIFFFGILCLYGILLMIPFIQETNLKYIKMVSVHHYDEVERYLLSNSMQKFVMNDGNTGELCDVLSDDLGATLPSIMQPVTYSKYKVRKGDNVTNIARRFGLANISTIIAVNEIQNVRLLGAGTTLNIPSMDGIYHKVKSGESLAEIAKKYLLTVENLLDVNDLESTVIKKGEKLFIPGARLDSDSLRDAMGETFKMPIKGTWKLTSVYGYRADPFTGQRKFHTGIDMAAPLGTKIYAAMAGKVATTGYNNVFGNYVIISHGNGYQSLYAHLSKYTVRAGQFIEQGAQLGLMGSTGYSTGSHLHLSIYKNGKHVNPAPLLK